MFDLFRRLFIVLGYMHVSYYTFLYLYLHLHRGDTDFILVAICKSSLNKYVYNKRRPVINRGSVIKHSPVIKRSPVFKRSPVSSVFYGTVHCILICTLSPFNSFMFQDFTRRLLARIPSHTASYFRSEKRRA